MSTGVIWLGPVFDRGGYGNVSRNYLLGLHRSGFPVQVVNTGEVHSEVDSATRELFLSLENADAGSDPVVVYHGLPPGFGQAGRYAPRMATRRIGCTVFETDRIPTDWVGECNQMDEVWVPSRFNVETFATAGVDRSKLRIVPYAVDTKLFNPSVPTHRPYHFKRPANRFKFLYNFAFDYRKGFDLLLEAYYSEFSCSDDVTLILKSYLYNDFVPNDPNVTPNLQGELAASVGRRVDLFGGALPHIILLDSTLGQEELRDLYLACDAYVSTERATGWGMPCLEMMAVGKPSAAIDWSGSTEFMNEDNSFLIHPTGRLVPVDERLQRTRPMYEGHCWAEVTVKEVQRVLRLMFESRELREQISARALEDVEARYAVEQVASCVVEALNNPLEVMTVAPVCSANVESDSTPGDDRHRLGIQRFQEGRFEEAARLTSEALLHAETSELWNDWGTAEFSCGRATEAERGFRRALEMDPRNSEAAVNLGVLLVGLERYNDAIPFLERGTARPDPDDRAQLVGLLADCRARQAQSSELDLDKPSYASAIRVPSPRKRVVFTGDVLRPIPHQGLNIQWLADLLRYPVSMAADAEMDVHLGDAEKGSIDGSRFYKLNGSEVSPENWGRLFDAKDISVSSAEYLGTFFENAIVVGFELPDVMIRLFQARGIPYLDFIIHPVRYMDDLFFGIRTNVTEMFTVLTHYVVPEELFRIHAGIHMATVGRMAPLDISPNSCLFVGQTPMDKSLLKDGSFQSVEDFAEQIRKIARSYNKIYFKPHPYGSEEDRTMKLLKDSGRVEITRANVYQLLAQKNVQEVCGISSSVLYEAEYFGKKVTHLSKNRLNLYGQQQNSFDPWTFVPVIDAFYNPRFWANLLSATCSVKECPDLKPVSKSSRLRNSLQMFWGYNFLDAEILLQYMNKVDSFDFGGAAPLGDSEGEMAVFS